MKKPPAFPTGKAISILCAKACDISAMNRLSSSSAPLAQPFYAWAWLRPSAIGLTILLAILSLFVLSPIYLWLTSAVGAVEGAGNVANFSLAPWRAAFSEPGIGKAFF